MRILLCSALLLVLAMTPAAVASEPVVPLAVPQLAAQERPPPADDVQALVAVDAQVVALTNVQLLTLNGARILGEDEQIGSVAAGKIADLVVVRGDPLRDPEAIYDVATVFKDGLGFDAERMREYLKGRVGVF